MNSIQTSLFSVVDGGHVMTLGWPLALCLCGEHENCETWEVMSEADRQKHFTHREKQCSFMAAVCTSSVRMENGHLSTAAQGVGGRRCACALMGLGVGKQKLILAHYSNPVDAKRQYVFLTAVEAGTLSAFVLKCQTHAHYDCVHLVRMYLGCGVFKLEQSLQASVYSAVGVFKKVFV